MPVYSVEILYRTASGCGTARFPEVEAAGSDLAYQECVAKVRQRRSVIKIDGGDVVDVTKKTRAQQVRRGHRYSDQQGLANS